MFQALADDNKKQRCQIIVFSRLDPEVRIPIVNAARVGPGTGRLAPDGLGHLTGTKRSEN